MMLLLERVYAQNTKKLVLQKYNIHLQLCFLILAFCFERKSVLLIDTTPFDCVHCLLALLQSLGKKAPNLVDPIDQAILSHWVP
jgi:glyoxylase-like metal-dependent hydrolase (beta-lactamase superfamily II)